MVNRGWRYKHQLLHHRRGKNNWLLCLLSGLGISLLGALFILFGVRFVLLLVETWQLPKQVLVIYTSIFYGIVFLFARAGVRVKSRWKYAPVNEEHLEDETEALSEKRSVISRVRTAIWVSFGIVSVLWLTPALAIYWISPLHPNRVILLCASIFGLAAAAIYFVGNDEKFLSITDRLMFCLGACFGPIIVVFLFSDF